MAGGFGPMDRIPPVIDPYTTSPKNGITENWTRTFSVTGWRDNHFTITPKRVYFNRSPPTTVLPELTTKQFFNGNCEPQLHRMGFEPISSGSSSKASSGKPRSFILLLGASVHPYTTLQWTFATVPETSVSNHLISFYSRQRKNRTFLHLVS